MQLQRSTALARLGQWELRECRSACKRNRTVFVVLLLLLVIVVVFYFITLTLLRDPL